MINYIQGQPLGRAFRALVTHNGVTSTLNQYTTDELWFMQRDFNGTLWDNRDNYERWDPLTHVKEWATPQFVVHSAKDYRLPESEGLMLFNILQERGVESRFLSFEDEGHWFVFLFLFSFFFFFFFSFFFPCFLSCSPSRFWGGAPSLLPPPPVLPSHPRQGETHTNASRLI
jgi:Prolyl oligopeptidase family